jgi:DNA-binding CsgD family transcriptional regulator
VASDVGGQDAALGRILSKLAESTGAPRAIAVALECVPEGLALRDLHVAGLDAHSSREAVARVLAGGGGGAAPLLPLSPSASDRNVPAVLRGDDEALPAPAALLARALGVAGWHAVRVAVCDGALMVAWIALFKARPFGPSERQLLAEVCGPLGARLAREREVVDAPVATTALDAALEAIGAPAFVVDPAGRVRRSNRAGHALLARDPATADELRACSAGRGSARFRMTQLAPDGGHVLAVAASAGGGLAARLDAALRRWRLTPRQGEVLAHVAEGRSNKTVAAELACSESTVEIHVSALLAKARCESRAHLVARFWSEMPGPS